MLRTCLAACLIAGCYGPTPSIGVPCGTAGTCPSGLQCVRGTCELGPGDPVTDAAIDAVPDGPLVWSTATKIPGVNSSDSDEDPSLTADRLAMVFASDRDTSYDLFLGVRATPSEPFVVGPLTALNSDDDEFSPEISPDGKTIHFISTRATSADVYRAVRTPVGWTVSPVPALSDEDGDEDDVAISPDELTAIIVRDGHMYRATRDTPAGTFGTPMAVPELDISDDVGAPAIGGSGAVYFHAGATRDLYVAQPRGTGYAAAAPIAELNTTARDASPFVSADETALWFERAGELYQATR